MQKKNVVKRKCKYINFLKKENSILFVFILSGPPICNVLTFGANRLIQENSGLGFTITLRRNVNEIITYAR